MPMNSAVLAAAITARMLMLWRSEPPSVSSQDGNYFLTQLGMIIAEEVVNHITANANAVGLDSAEDDHTLDIV